MIPQIALVGRPNVGKSSLFNALTGRRRAIVADFSGVTRDRRFGVAKPLAYGERPISVVDTGGWMPDAFRRDRADEELLGEIEKQVLLALRESSVIVLVMDVREGLTALDESLVSAVRRLGRPFVIAANKADRPGELHAIGDFYSLGADQVIPVSAEHKLGLQDFWECLAPFFGDYLKEGVRGEAGAAGEVRVCIVGRPNVGKSSLLNRLVGEERSVASAVSGTTTDPVDVALERAGRRFVLVDTAGIRRHARREHDVENLAVMYAERNLNEADVALLVLDAEDGVTSQDARIGALVEESGCTAIVIANKWDRAPEQIRSSRDGIKKFRDRFEKEMPFLDYAPLVAISAERGQLYGAKEGSDSLEPVEPWPLPESLDDLWSFAAYLVECRQEKIPPEELAAVVQQAMDVGPQWVGELGELRRVHQVGQRPPQFLAFVKDANAIPEAFRRYLSRTVRERWGYRGNPIRWVFKHRH
ncbi:MAG: ribosome biogenesis GTPase Der [Bdellovibrionales bacterium]|nr:ribosome biogenesis GTPase Der [Bdellovibrionales bacterium]